MDCKCNHMYILIKDRQRTFGTATESLWKMQSETGGDVWPQTQQPEAGRHKEWFSRVPEGNAAVLDFQISVPLEFWDSIFQVNKWMYQPDPSLTKFTGTFLLMVLFIDECDLHYYLRVIKWCFVNSLILFPFIGKPT